MHPAVTPGEALPRDAGGFFMPSDLWKARVSHMPRPIRYVVVGLAGLAAATAVVLARRARRIRAAQADPLMAVDPGGNRSPDERDVRG